MCQKGGERGMGLSAGYRNGTWVRTGLGMKKKTGPPNNQNSSVSKKILK